MGALGHYLEREGIPTAQISLIREQTAAIRPPRALWVPFMLGRPFGAPNAPDFQRRVLRQLVQLFQHTAGPVLEDFPEDAPADASGSDDQTGFACPVSFAAPESAKNPASRMAREIDQLTPWYELAKKRRGRSSVGISGMGIDAAARYAGGFLSGADAAGTGGAHGSDADAGTTLKRACDDIKAYYYEAVAAQPGNLSARAIERWFWNETAAAEVFLALREVCLASKDPSLDYLGRISLVPRWVQHARGGVGFLSLPNLGSSIPKMGALSPSSSRARRGSSLADALFSITQQRVLGLLFGQPDRSFYATEIIAQAGAGSGAVQRELARLEQSGLVTVRKVGLQKHYQANPESPLYEELCGIARKTMGLAEPLREGLSALRERITAAFIFGSVARKEDRAASDIDLMVISDDVAYSEIFSALEAVHARLGRTVNPQVYSRADWRRRIDEGNAFVRRLVEQPKVWIYGSEHELSA